MHLKDPRISLLTTWPDISNCSFKIWFWINSGIWTHAWWDCFYLSALCVVSIPVIAIILTSTKTALQLLQCDNQRLWTPFYPLPTGACTHSTAAMSIPSCAPTRQYELVHPSINLLIHTNKNTRICTQTHACNAYTHRHACIYIRIIDKIYECFE